MFWFARFFLHMFMGVYMSMYHMCAVAGESRKGGHVFLELELWAATGAGDWRAASALNPYPISPDRYLFPGERSVPPQCVCGS